MSTAATPLRRVMMAVGIVALLATIFLVFAPLSPAAAECKPPGIPDYAGSGVNGTIDTKTEAPSNGNYYGLYGWGGLRWNTCDTAGSLGIVDVLAELDTWAGNALLGAASGLAAIMTGMHKWSADPGAMLAGIDEKITQLSQIGVELFFGQWAFALIVFAAIGVLAAAFTKNIRTALMTVLCIGAACGFISMVSAFPLTIAQSTDGVASAIVSAADQKALEYAGIPDASPEGGGIYATPEEATGAILRDTMLQPMWRMGQSGVMTPADPTEAMFKASTASYAEVAEGYDPEKKRDDYNSAVDAVKNDESIANQYQTIKGQSYNRTGAGFLALLMVGTVALIRIPAEALMFLGVLVIRFIPIIGPIFAALAIPEQTRPAAVSALKIVAAAVFNVVVFGTIAAVHTAVTAILYVNTANLFVNTIISVLVTYLLLNLSKPYRSVTKLATGRAAAQAMEAAPDGPGNALKGLIGMATGTVIGGKMLNAVGTGRDKKGKEGKDKEGRQLQTLDREHGGPEPVVHEGWKEAPPVHEGWSNDPTVAPITGTDDDGPYFQPETPLITDRNDPANITFEGNDGTVSVPLEMPDVLIEPEWEDGHLVSSIFIPEPDIQVEAQEGHTIHVEQPFVPEPIVHIDGLDGGRDHIRLEL